MTKLVGYFGFGSLVNRETLRTEYVDHLKVRLKGWRRQWVPRDYADHPDIALLSIEQQPEGDILGMLVIDRLENLAAVDEREKGYDRLPLTMSDIQFLDKDTAPSANSSSGINDGSARQLPSEIYVYVARKDVDEGGQVGGNGSAARQKLLQSYTDAVMKGFLSEYGEEGVRHFAETTVGFDREIHLDRKTPLYPRSVTVSDEEAAFFDHTLKQAGVIFP